MAEAKSNGPVLGSITRYQGEQVDPALYHELVKVTGEPPQEINRLQRDWPDFMNIGFGNQPISSRKQHYRLTKLDADLVGVKGMHTIPNDPNPWLDLYSMRPILYYSNKDVVGDTHVVLRGYRIGDIQRQEEKVEHIQESRRGINRFYLLDKAGSTWSYETWNEWIKRCGLENGHQYGKVLEEPLPDKLWERVLEEVGRASQTLF